MKKALLFTLLPLAAIASDKHVHGEADLFLAIDGTKVLIELESPAANLLGFEHPPHTEQQNQRLHDVNDQLHKYSALVQFPNGGCTQQSVTINAPFTKEATQEKEAHHEHDDHKEHGEHDDHKGHKEHDDHKEHGEHDDHKGHEDHKEHEEHDDHKEHGEHDDHKGHEDHDDDQHAEFHVSYQLTCTNPNNITYATVNAFSAFSLLEKVTVNWLTATQQGSTFTYPKKVRVDL